LDVFIEEQMPEFVGRLDRPALNALRQRLRAHRARAYERARAALREAEETRLFDACAEWIENSAGSDATPAGRPLADFAAHALRDRRRKLRRKGRRLRHLDPAERHRLRIEAKKLRYAIEFFAPL